MFQWLTINYVQSLSFVLQTAHFESPKRFHLIRVKYTWTTLKYFRGRLEKWNWLQSSTGSGINIFKNGGSGTAAALKFSKAGGTGGTSGTTAAMKNQNIKVMTSKCKFYMQSKKLLGHIKDQPKVFADNKNQIYLRGALWSIYCNKIYIGMCPRMSQVVTHNPGSGHMIWPIW